MVNIVGRPVGKAAPSRVGGWKENQRSWAAVYVGQAQFPVKRLHLPGCVGLQRGFEVGCSRQSVSAIVACVA
jgi:hypothetical protein